MRKNIGSIFYAEGRWCQYVVLHIGYEYYVIFCLNTNGYIGALI